ncbi:uncharacterized protein MONBRDRAFT_36955 [Monosiga brevicollis MX1]|uniref:GPI-anchor transamidase n=1 Tax=Monosiga brevicollis TaxID=81824 RepID=A9UYN1_MONBE|nr:uncharacterized protein MONBRDRAFT_36955 [Monosiga brevicollis MX1]EDQ89633.1 predicted protein [Monosiga brevicollis MX1]|eukprot:XP_001745662.1 hypothetical protein [Monosiga brevicollis MX1]
MAALAPPGRVLGFGVLILGLLQLSAYTTAAAVKSGNQCGTWDSCYEDAQLGTAVHSNWFIAGIKTGTWQLSRTYYNTSVAEGGCKTGAQTLVIGWGGVWMDMGDIAGIDGARGWRMDSDGVLVVVNDQTWVDKLNKDCPCGDTWKLGGSRNLQACDPGCDPIETIQQICGQYSLDCMSTYKTKAEPYAQSYSTQILYDGPPDDTIQNSSGLYQILTTYYNDDTCTSPYLRISDTGTMTIPGEGQDDTRNIDNDGLEMRHTPWTALPSNASSAQFTDYEYAFSLTNGECLYPGQQQFGICGKWTLLCSSSEGADDIAVTWAFEGDSNDKAEIGVPRILTTCTDCKSQAALGYIPVGSPGFGTIVHEDEYLRIGKFLTDANEGYDTPFGLDDQPLFYIDKCKLPETSWEINGQWHQPCSPSTELTDSVVNWTFSDDSSFQREYNLYQGGVGCASNDDLVLTAVTEGTVVSYGKLENSTQPIELSLTHLDITPLTDNMTFYLQAQCACGGTWKTKSPRSLLGGCAAGTCDDFDWLRIEPGKQSFGRYTASRTLLRLTELYATTDGLNQNFTVEDYELINVTNGLPPAPTITPFPPTGNPTPPIPTHTPTPAPAKKGKGGLSGGDIVLLIAFLSVFVYVVGGMLINYNGQGVVTTGTNDWVVIVSTSKFWYNYRHTTNALAVYHTVKRLGIPDERILLMIADNHACNPRNIKPGRLFHDRQIKDNLFGRLPRHTPRHRRLNSDASSRIFLYMTGPVSTRILMIAEPRYKEIVFVLDTCHAETMGSKIRAPHIASIGSSLRVEDSYSHQVSPHIGVSLSDEFSAHMIDILATHEHNSTLTFAELTRVMDFLADDTTQSTTGQQTGSETLASTTAPVALALTSLQMDVVWDALSSPVERTPDPSLPAMEWFMALVHRILDSIA